MVKLKLVVPFSGMLAAPKDLAMLEGLFAFRLAEAAFPVTPLVEETAPCVVVDANRASGHVHAETHDALAARVAPARLTLPLPATRNRSFRRNR